MRRFLLIAVVVLTPACARVAPPASSFAPVLAASDEERASLDGLWRGYIDADGDRGGDVEFRFEAGGALLLAGRSAPSRILWLRLDGTRLTGALETYYDAKRTTEVYTVFEAVVEDGRLRGVLRERVNLQWRDLGTWTAFRVE